MEVSTPHRKQPDTAMPDGNIAEPEVEPATNVDQRP
jgi:hypothetical protein